MPPANQTPACDKPRPAATVVPVRPHRGDLQVYLLRRSPRSRFMAGNYVFPGGVLEPADRDTHFWGGRLDLDAEAFERRLGGSLAWETALAFTVAAVRETFEEAGILLARPTGRGRRERTTLEASRAAGDLTEGWLKALAERGWVLTTAALRRWAHWITPEAMPRRYDTRFFLAFLPQGQVGRPDRRETSDGRWVTPRQGLVGNLSREIPLSPPTVVTLQMLLPYRAIEDLYADCRTRPWGPALRPRLVRTAAGPVIVEPWDPAYQHPTITIDADALEGALLPAGVPFSRIWCREGFWQPVAAC